MAAIFKRGRTWIAGVVATAVASVAGVGGLLLVESSKLHLAASSVAPATGLPASGIGSAPLMTPAASQSREAGPRTPLPGAQPSLSPSLQPVSPTAGAAGLAATAVETPDPARSASTPGQAPAATPAMGAPEFDVVRVEPSGEAVIAGRATAGVKVALLDREREVATTMSDASGQFVFVPPLLSTGDHVLQLQSADDKGSSLSVRKVRVAVPGSGKGIVFIDFVEPSAPADASQGKRSSREAPVDQNDATASIPAAAPATPLPAGGPTSPSRAAPPPAPSNVASPTSPEGHALAGPPPTVGEDPDDIVSSLPLPDQPGPPELTSPAELPASKAPDAPPPAARPVTVLPAAHSAAPAWRRAAPAATTRPLAKVSRPTAARPTPDPRTMQVHPGDSLWRIGQKLYGDGMRFLDIYRANARRIFNPERIYPGQVFVMPGRTN